MLNNVTKPKSRGRNNQRAKEKEYIVENEKAVSENMC